MTVDATEKVKRGPRVRGIGADAATLGVNRSHLWEVLKGRRQSQSLRARYQALKQAQQEEAMKTTLKLKPAKLSPQGRAPMPPEFAALQNLQPSFFETLSKLKLEVVVVKFEAGKDSPIWAQKDISGDLDSELKAVKAGEFDSSFFPLGAQFHFFQIKSRKLGAAMHRLKAAIEARGLLEISGIYHAESAELLVEWYPGTAAKISVPIEPT
jgi:hypothetical protein